MAGTLRDRLLPVLDRVARGRIDQLGFRQSRVFIIRRTWSLGRIGEGEPTKTEREITPRPKIEEVDGTNIVLVDKITPKYDGGGYTIAELSPATTSGSEYWIEIRGPRGTYHYAFGTLDAGKATKYTLRLKAMDRPVDIADPT